MRKLYLTLLLRRYADKSSTDLELEDFLVKAYKKQIKELNSSTGKPASQPYL